MILSLLLLLISLPFANPPRPCLLQMIELKRQAKLAKFKQWLHEQKPEDPFKKRIRESQEWISKMDKLMEKK